MIEAPAYFNEHGHVIGHIACTVSEWVAAHPDYDGCIWFDNGDGGDHVEVTEIFLGEDE